MGNHSTFLSNNIWSSYQLAQSSIVRFPVKFKFNTNTLPSDSFLMFSFQMSKSFVILRIQI